MKFPGRELHKRLVFSYFAEFGDPLKDPEVSSYSDFLLLRIAQEAGSRKQEAGSRQNAKDANIQVNTSWELGSVPVIPAYRTCQELVERIHRGQPTTNSPRSVFLNHTLM
ncbi:hypothetical protein KCV26_01250 [Petrimonas sulfuriphila]|uniref:hypothetical protein n=1 Tax=Petrimonas sulfuriphila TaxID=285070 RepID=UPI003246B542